MTISNYAELKLLDAVLNNVSFAVATVYVKLHLGDPGEDGTGNPSNSAQPLSPGPASSPAPVPVPDPARRP